jgi:hypothetical protein
MFTKELLFLQLLFPCYHVGHLAEGTYNFTSLESPQEEEPLRQIHDVDDEAQDLDNIVVHEVPDEDNDSTIERQASEVATVERSANKILCHKTKKVRLQLLKEVDIEELLLHQETNRERGLERVQR